MAVKEPSSIVKDDFHWKDAHPSSEWTLTKYWTVMRLVQHCTMHQSVWVLGFVCGIRISISPKVLQCYQKVIIFSSPKWPIMCHVGH